MNSVLKCVMSYAPIINWIKMLQIKRMNGPVWIVYIQQEKFRFRLTVVDEATILHKNDFHKETLKNHKNTLLLN